MLLSPISYQGSKKRETHIIEEYQPKRFNKVVDVFGGGGSVSLFYIQNYNNCQVHYNDISPDLTLLFEVLKDHDKTKKVVDHMHKLKSSKEDFIKRQKELKEAYEKNKPSLINFLYCTSYGYGGNMFSGTIITSNNKPRSISFDKFLKYPDVIKDLHITKLDALDVIEQYKNDEYAFLYLDPPYLQKGTSNSAYRNMSVDLLNTIFSIIKNKDYKCRIMLHIDFSGWVYAEMKDYIKYYYPAKYMMTCGKNKKNGNTGNGKSYHQRYSALICNY